MPSAGAASRSASSACTSPSTPRAADVNAVVHAHPPTATGFAVAGVPLDEAFIAEAVVSLGPGVPTVPFAAPGADAASALEPFTHDYDAALLANHGVIAWGPDLESRLFAAGAGRASGEVALVARQLGGVRPLPPSVLPKLLDARAKAGLGPAAASAPLAPATGALKTVVACAPAPPGSDVEVYESQACAPDRAAVTDGAGEHHSPRDRRSAQKQEKAHEAPRSLAAARSQRPALAQDKPAADAGTAQAQGQAQGKKGKRAALLDINTATDDALKALPGITDDQVKKIVAGRPYTGKDQLLKQNIVDKDEYAEDSAAHPRQAAEGYRRPRRVGAHTGPGPSSATTAAPASGATAAPKK